jgi:hypothetical protein
LFNFGRHILAAKSNKFRLAPRRHWPCAVFVTWTTFHGKFHRPTSRTRGKSWTGTRQTKSRFETYCSRWGPPTSFTLCPPPSRPSSYKKRSSRWSDGVSMQCSRIKMSASWHTQHKRRKIPRSHDDDRVSGRLKIQPHECNANKIKKESQPRGGTSLDTDLLTASDNRLFQRYFKLKSFCCQKRAETWRRVRYSRSNKLMFVLAAQSTGHDPRIRMPDIESVIFQSITPENLGQTVVSEDYSNQ